MLKSIRHKKVSDQVFEQIRDMIYRGEFSPGERLKSERDLAATLKVGRPAVREAIQKLIDRGLVESRRGVGTYVLDSSAIVNKSPMFQIFSDEKISIVDFIEVRMALELKGAELAAKRANDEDIRKIEECLKWNDPNIVAKKQVINSDINFHMNITYASKNSVQIHLMKNLYDIQHYIMNLAYVSFLAALQNDELIYAQHTQIYEAIKNRDAVKARKAMEDHLELVLELYRNGDLQQRPKNLH